MKKKLKNVLIILLILVLLGIFGILTIVFLDYDEEKERHELMLKDFGEITYDFYGISENFKFSTGKVHFSDREHKIYIDDFYQQKKIKNLKSETIYIYFNNKVWSTYKNQVKLNKINKRIDTFQFYEGGYLCTEDEGIQCEETEFNYANKENFKDIIKMEMEYCLVDNQCFKESFKIMYR